MQAASLVRPLFRFSLLLLAATVLAAASLAPRRYRVVDGSHFWIEGTSTLGGYTCVGERVNGRALVAESDKSLAAELSVPVAAFDCRRSQMTRDFREALKSKEHPLIQIVVDEAFVDDGAQRGAWVPVQADARIRLAGVERSVTLQAQGRSSGNGHVQIRGEHSLRMTDFGVRPPSGLGGLVRAHNRVVARFDLLAVPES